MQKQSVVHYITKATVDVMFYGGIVCVLLVPFIVRLIRQFYGYGESVTLPFAIILYLSGICAVYILYNLKQMFKTLLGGNPFDEKNISCFRKMAVTCALIALIFTVKLFIIFSFATLGTIAAFTLGALFCLTLKDIFKQAMYYKEEHDWTV